MYLKILALIFLAVFYAVYIGKMIMQKKKGIKTDQIARGSKSGSTLNTELIMKIATYSVVGAEVFSIIMVSDLPPLPVSIIGIILCMAGDAVFAAAVYTMKDSWRAGISTTDKTSIVTAGIYQYSRNPAFLGFDLLYAGLLLLFFNWFLLAFSIFAMVMLHLQILQEEKFLPQVFGSDYISYKNKVNRYIGRSSLS